VPLRGGLQQGLSRRELLGHAPFGAPHELLQLQRLRLHPRRGPLQLGPGGQRALLGSQPRTLLLGQGGAQPLDLANRKGELSCAAAVGLLRRVQLCRQPASLSREGRGLAGLLGLFQGRRAALVLRALFEAPRALLCGEELPLQAPLSAVLPVRVQLQRLLQSAGLETQSDGVGLGRPSALLGEPVLCLHLLELVLHAAAPRVQGH